MSPPAAARSGAGSSHSSSPEHGGGGGGGRGAGAGAGGSGGGSGGGKRALPPKWKPMLWAIGFGSVIFTGTIYGAGLKTRREWESERQKVREATVDEKISMLQDRRAALERQKRDIEAKLGEVRARIQRAAS